MTVYGIYKITNLLNGMMYIGKHKTSNINDGYMGSGLLLERAIKKHGKDNFRKEWLMFCEDEEEMNYMERVFVDQNWVDRSDTYNLKLGGEGGGCGANKGYHFTEEQKKHVSEAHKGISYNRKGMPEEVKKRISITQRQRMTHEMRERISKALIGRKKPEHSKRMSGRRHFNNKIISIMAYECPEGFVPGRLPFKKKEGSK